MMSEESEQVVNRSGWRERTHEVIFEADTPLGQVLASLVMIMGYGIIAVPTGIVTAEITRDVARTVSTQACPSCSLDGHAFDAVHCKYCGTKL